jgi:hypothetical protein
MSKGLWVVIIILVIAIPAGLVGYGYNQGKNMGRSGASQGVAFVVAVSMNPLSQAGFKKGYQKGIIQNQEIEKKIKEFIGHWVGWDSKDPITDFENYHLKNDGDIGLYNKKASLNLTCRNNKTEVYINWGGHLLQNRNREFLVTYRIDSNKAVTSNWNLSTDKKAFFYNGKSISFIKSLIDSKKLVVQFKDTSTKTITFQLDKLDEKIVPLAKSCNWKV